MVVPSSDVVAAPTTVTAAAAAIAYVDLIMSEYGCPILVLSEGWTRNYVLIDRIMWMTIE